MESPSGGAVLDGNVLRAGSKVWMEELYPTSAPTRFDVEAILDAALDSALGEVITGPAFGVKAKDFAAYSDRPWVLPDPPASSGSISYRFRDNGDRLSGPVTVATLATLDLGLKAGTADEIPTITLSIDADLRIEADVAFERSADVAVVLLTPWESGSDGLRDYVRAYFGEVTRDPDLAEAATERFFMQNADALPQSRPSGWQFGAEPGAMSGEAGSGTNFALTGTVPSSATTLMALKLVDRSDPLRVAVSKIFRVEAIGPDVPPTVNVLSPEGFSQGTSHWLRSVDGQLFTEMQLQANVTDADGPIPDQAIVWSTDRGELQPNGAELGRGEFLIARLYADSCAGATHVVTVTVDDQTGHVVRETGTVTLTCDVS